MSCLVDQKWPGTPGEKGMWTNLNPNKRQQKQLQDFFDNWLPDIDFNHWMHRPKNDIENFSRELETMYKNQAENSRTENVTEIKTQ